jgi:Ciliary BBSome complex subunit 2, C-terminal
MWWKAHKRAHEKPRNGQMSGVRMFGCHLSRSCHYTHAWPIGFDNMVVVATTTDTCMSVAEPHGTGTRLTIMADNIQVVGDIFHALANHLGLSEQSCISEFPSQISLARQALRDAADGSMMATRMQADVADSTAVIKTLVCFHMNSREETGQQRMNI